MANRLPNTYNLPWDQGAIRGAFDRKDPNVNEFVEYMKKLVRVLYGMYQEIANHANDHSDNHVSGELDEIDGDQLDVDWNPSNYTPTADGTYASSVDHLSSHLNGLDSVLPIQGAAGSKPAASVDYRGRLYITEGGTGVADTIDVCLKDAADAYAWVNIA